MPTKNGIHAMNPAILASKLKSAGGPAMAQADGAGAEEDLSQNEGNLKTITLLEQPDGSWQVQCEGGEGPGGASDEAAGMEDQPQTFTDPKELMAYVMQEVDPGAAMEPNADDQGAGDAMSAGAPPAGGNALYGDLTGR